MQNSYRPLTLALSLVAAAALTAGCGDDDGGGTGGSGNSGTGATGGSTGGTGNSGGSGGSDGGAGNAGGGGAGVVAPPACADYCDEIDTACGTDKPQYIDLPGACEAYCAVLETGTDADVNGVDVTGQTDTLACRAYHLSAVPMDAELHCPHAGPAGEGQCGNKIESFCAAQAALCTDTNRVYVNEAACVADMTDNVTDDGTFDATDIDGNTLNCRIYHLTAAAALPDDHCQHTGGPNADSGDSALCIN